VIVPSRGWAGDDGGYCRGNDIGWTSEADLVDLYVSYLADILDQEGIRHSILGTRKAPGIRAADRHTMIPVNSLVLHCAMGWHRNHIKQDLGANISRTFYQLATAYALARDVAEAIGQWGDLTVHGHRCGKPQQDTGDKLLCPDGSQGIRIEPFLINGPGIQDYAKHMARLGRDIGMAVAEYCREIQQGVLVRTAVIR